MFDRQVSFFEVTEHIIRLVDGQRQIVPGRTWNAPGLTSAAVHGYFDFADDIHVATKPFWLDLEGIQDPVEPVFCFAGFSITSEDPGYGYLMQYYADFVKEFFDRTRPEY
jgi:hypothetical protein